MEHSTDSAVQNYKWTALMKLKGQTWARGGEDVLDEFDGFVQSLRGVAVDYNVIVLVDGKAPRQFHSEYNTTEPRTARERSGA
jgi:hypothetical protein